MGTQYSCLGNLRDRGAWHAAVHGVAIESDVTWHLNSSSQWKSPGLVGNLGQPLEKWAPSHSPCGSFPPGTNYAQLLRLRNDKGPLR